jgi:hypothetical protein
MRNILLTLGAAPEMTLRQSYSAIFCAGLMLFGCEQGFDAKGSLDQKIILYSIMSTDRDVQFVRVEQSYMPQSYDATDYTQSTYLSGARVTMTTGTKGWILRDTVLPRSDTIRYKDPIHAFVVNLRPGHSSAYRIDAVHPRLGTAYSIAWVPGKPILELNYFSNTVVDQPSSNSESADIAFTVQLGYPGVAFIGRMFVDYEVVIDGEWTSQRIEIPSGYQSSDAHDHAHVVYPKLVKPASYRTFVVIKNSLYRQALNDIAYNKYRTNRIVFDRMVYQCLQVDQNIYRYMNPNVDPKSIRLDEPILYNVTRGLGLVGAYSIDSLIHPLPDNFAFNH